MKTIKHCTNSELSSRLLNLVQREREMLADILLHIQEISRRKVFLEMGYPSMFSYMTEHLKYSPGSAMRRLDAAKVAAQTPEVLKQLQTGSLNLSQVSMLEQSVRQMKKADPQRSFSVAMKSELLQSLSGKTKAESEVLIAQTLGITPAIKAKTEHQADESVTMTLTFTKEEWAEMQQMRELLSNATGGGLKETLVHVARKVIRQKTVIQRNKISAVTLSGKTPAPGERSAIPSSIRKAVRQQHQGCQYTDPKTGKICGSGLFPTMEHRQPVWAGGTNNSANLTSFCSAHNIFKYRQQAGFA